MSVVRVEDRNRGMSTDVDGRKRLLFIGYARDFCNQASTYLVDQILIQDSCRAGHRTVVLLKSKSR